MWEKVAARTLKAYFNPGIDRNKHTSHPFNTNYHNQSHLPPDFTYPKAPLGADASFIRIKALLSDLISATPRTIIESVGNLIAEISYL